MSMWCAGRWSVPRWGRRARKRISHSISGARLIRISTGCGCFWWTNAPVGEPCAPGSGALWALRGVGREGQVGGVALDGDTSGISERCDAPDPVCASAKTYVVAQSGGAVVQYPGAARAETRQFPIAGSAACADYGVHRRFQQDGQAVPVDLHGSAARHLTLYGSPDRCTSTTGY